MATYKSVNFDGRVTSKVAITETPQDDGTVVPYFGGVEMRPEVGMTVHVFYDSSAAPTTLNCFPLNVPNPEHDLSLEQRRAVNHTSGIDRPGDVIGDGTITAVQYKPGRSGKLYPWVDVEVPA